jgi:hypothetical protein
MDDVGKCKPLPATPASPAPEELLLRGIEKAPVLLVLEEVVVVDEEV